MRRLPHLLLATAVALSISAQPSSTYYSSANGKSDAALKTALFNIIKNHTVISYDGLITAYKTTDVDSNGKIWDIYSNYRFSTSSKCGNYSEEGDCYNREHTVPQSWFGESSPMKSDLFHVLPTDGYVNGKRSNYPYGDVGTTSYTSGNGSKVGACSDQGFSGTVFEPIDEYKGDIARIYFYMATRYEDKISTWSGGVFGTSSGFENGLKEWAINVLLQWHRNDPVSQKEIDRNNNVYTLQKNRNPFVDYPRLAEYIWGDDMTESVDFSQLTLYSNNPASGSSSTQTFTIYYNGNGGSTSVSSTAASSDGSVTLTSSTPTRSGYTFIGWNTRADGTGITYTAGSSLTLTASLTLYAQWQNNGSDTDEGNLFSDWVLVTDASGLVAGDKYVIASNSYSSVAGDITSNNILSIVKATFDSGYSIIEDLDADALILTLGGSEGAWTFANDEGELLGTTAVKKMAFGKGTTTWNISISSDGTATIASTSTSCGTIYYNNLSPRFTTYTSTGQKLPQLYHYASNSSGTSAETFPITTSASEGGQIEVNTDNAAAGSTVFITASPDEGYLFDAWDIRTASGSLVEVVVNSGNSLVGLFTMPADSVTVSATFSQRTVCSVQWFSEGTLFHSESVYSGETITLPSSTPSPVSEGFVFKGWTTLDAVSSDGTGITYATEPFTVSDDVTFRAVFALATTTEGSSSTTLLSDDFTDATGSASEEYSKEGYTIVKVFPASGSLKMGSGSYVGTLSFNIDADAGSTVTISLDAKPYDSDENTLVVSVSGISDSWTITTTSTSSYETFSRTFVLTEDSPTITLSTTNSSKRIYVDNLLVSKGTTSVTTYSDFTLSTQAQLRGDVNADGRTDVSDVTALVSHILGTANYDTARCDVNADGTITVSDVTSLVGIILSTGE